MEYKEEWRATAFGVYSGEFEIADCALGEKRQPGLTITEAQTNAERIVKAVNCHDDLVEALKLCVVELQAMILVNEHLRSHADSSISAGLQALAKAEAL